MVKNQKHPLALPKLESLVYCPGILRYLSGEPPPAGGLDSLFSQTLTAGRRPELAEFSPFLVRSGISFQDIPTLFGTSPNQPHLTWPHPYDVSALEDSIQYCFSDGLTLNAREILYHPYSFRVPLALLPLVPQVQLLIHQSAWMNLLATESSARAWRNFRLAEECLLNILFEAQAIAKKRPPEDPLKIWISPENSPEKSRQAFSIERLDVLLEMKSRWTLEPSKKADSADISSGEVNLTFQEIPLHPGGYLFENFEINPTQGSLLFHSYKRCVEMGLRELLDASLFEDPSFGIQKAVPLHFNLKGHQKIQKVLAQVNENLVQKGYPPVVHPEKLTLTPDQVKVSLRLSRDGKFTFFRQFSLGHRSVEISNLPHITQLFLLGVQGGIGATTLQDHRIYAQDRRGQRRDRDLKILKHSGCFALMLAETLSFSLRKKSVDGKPLTTLTLFFEHLFEKLGFLLFEIEKKAGFFERSPAPPLDRLCSKTVIDLIKKTTTQWIQLCEKNEETFFLSEGEVCIQGGIKAAYRIFDEILSSVILRSRGQCFLKLRSSLFQGLTSESELADLEVGLTPLLTAQEYSPLGQWLNAGQILQSFLPLRTKGIELTYEGMPLNEMEMNEFRPEFSLVEKAGTDPSSEQQAGAIDWFELHPKFFFQGQEIDPSSLERLTREGVLEFQGKIYLIQNKNLPNLKRLEAFWSKIQRAPTKGLRRKTHETYFYVPKSQTLEMLALRATGVKVTGGKKWEAICQFYDQLDQPREPLENPASLKAELKPYQKLGVRWLLDLYHLGLGGILADDMGLGKTIQTLGFLEILRTQNQMGPTLIVVPTSLTYNWMSEAARFAPELPIRSFQSKTKKEVMDFLSKNKNGAVVCTYGLFTEHQDFFEQYKWNILVFDEAQNLKNISAKRTAASRSVSAHFKICLTGTPLENHLGEFYSLLDLVVSGSLGDLSEFRERFVTPDTLDPVEVKYLKLKARPLILRRTKAEILKELPPKLESTVKLPFEQKQEKIYRDIALSWNEKVKGAILAEGEARSQILMLTALLRLRQACSDPASIPNVKYSEQPPKLGVLMEALREVTESGQSALVFTQFLHTFERVKRELQSNGIPVFSLHGGTSRAERERILKEFQNLNQGSVLLMTLKTGGVGLNLVKASYVFHMEPWWNPAVENQATDRAHRIGQDKAVQVYRYLMMESVEEKIEILKERKSARFNALFNSSETEKEVNLNDSRLTQADFEYLLS